MLENLTKNGIVNIKQYRNGKLIAERNFHNIITTAGKQEAAKLFGTGLGGTAFGYIALGTGTTAVAVGDTTLEGEITDTGLARAAATVTLDTTTVSNDTTKLSASFTATGAKAVTKIGIFNAASAGVLACEQLFAAINTANGDILAMTYKIANA